MRAGLVIPHHGVTPDLAPDVFLAPGSAVIGDVQIGEGSSIWFNTVVRGDVHHIRIGRRVNIQDLTMIHVTTGRHPTIIGDDVTVGHRVILHGCTVESGALIGMGAVVMDRAVIGRQSLIGAGSLVTEDTVIPPRTLAVGSPARPRRPLTHAELAELESSARRYAALARTYLPEGGDAR